MPMYDVLDTDGEVVRLRRLLGVLVDACLDAPLLKETRARGWSLFEEFFHAADTSGFSIPVAAAQVPLRIEPSVLYASALLVCAPGAKTALDRLQYLWGRQLLGFRAGPHVRWPIVAAQCGWDLRLGTRLVERAIMARAKILVLPDAHPAVALLRLADGVLAVSWSDTVRGLMSAPELLQVIPDMSSHPAFPSARLKQAQADKCLRKVLLQQYRWDIVRPALRRADRDAFLAVATQPLPGFNISYSSFQPQAERIPISFLAFDSGHETWLWYRLWALCRMTGCWPAPIRGADVLPVQIQVCPRCGASEVTVVHALCVCPGYAPMRSWARSLCTLPSEANGHAFLLTIFGQCHAPSVREVHIALVGKALIEGCDYICAVPK